MVSRPRVGIGSWDAIPSKQTQVYHDRVTEAGLDPVRLSHTGQTMEECVGLVLTGGVDVDPALYGEEPHRFTQSTILARDTFESALLHEALQRDIPILAICRGFQLLNVYLGGSLLQHIEGWEHAAQRDEARTSSQHTVSLSGQLSETLGASEAVVNSRHHQGLTADRLAASLEPLAFSSDGLVEAARGKEQRWLLGVQWHPERSEPHIPDFDSQNGQLFAAFAKAVAR